MIHILSSTHQSFLFRQVPHQNLAVLFCITTQIITEAHGGAIRAESEGAGNGSTFVVEFPVS